MYRYMYLYVYVYAYMCQVNLYAMGANSQGKASGVGESHVCIYSVLRMCSSVTSLCTFVVRCAIRSGRRQASIPLVKAIDPTGKEVDLCVGNRPGEERRAQTLC